MPYDTSNINYHADSQTAPGYFYKNNSLVTITYIPIPPTIPPTIPPPNYLFLIDPLLPEGLTIDTNNGLITGTTASNTLWDIEYAVTISKIETLQPNSVVATEYFRIVNSTEPKFTYLITSYTFKALTGSKFITESPIIQALLWENDYYFKLIPPAGSNIALSIHPKTGIITGTINTTEQIINSYKVKIINKFIEYEQTISIKTVSPLPNIIYNGLGVILNDNIFEFIQGISGSLQTTSITTEQSNNGMYSISGCNSATRLPLGLLCDGITGTIFGIPETISESRAYTITFTNSFETKNVVILLCVKRQYRLTPSLSYDVFITPELQMRKKAECLQHTSNKFNESKKQKFYKLLTRGSNNNIRSIECLSRNLLISSSSSDVPGPPINLFYDPTIQLIGNVTRIRPNNILPPS